MFEMMSNEMNELQVGSRVEVRIDRIVPRGFGIGFTEAITFFVPLTAPGDLVTAEISRQKGRIAWGEAVEIIEGGPQRIEPPCKYYGVCGGCDMQHLNYTAQLEAKKEIVRDCLRRIAGIEMPEFATVVPSPKEFGYRTRVRWHTDERGGEVGFKRRNSDEVIAIDHCPILDDGLNTAINDVASNRGDLPSELEASTDTDGRVAFWPDINGDSSELSIRIAGEEYRYSAECFFQANPALLEQLIKAAIGGLSGGKALDLYCGVGLFSLPLARSFQNVSAVESSYPSVKFARKNVNRAGLANVDIHAANVELFLSTADLDNYEAVVLDPPRSGPSHGVVANLATSGVRTISYVACEPSILARDLKTLLAAEYSITEMTLLDLFPQTHHIETVVRLVR
jgi:23S rRNA (uracil1939-C5)-methyltransferase